MQQQHQYPTLIRMLGRYTQVGQAMWGLFKSFNWEVVSILYHNHNPNSGRGNSECSFQLSSIIQINQNRSEFVNLHFDETENKRGDYSDFLRKIKAKSRSECFPNFFF